MVHRREMAPHGGHELVVHRQRHVVGKQRRLNGAWVMAHPRGIDIAFHRPGERGREGVGMGFVLVVILMEGGAPHACIGVVQERYEGGIGELHSIPLAGGDAAKFQIGIGQLAKDLRRRPGEGALHRQELLLRL